MNKKEKLEQLDKQILDRMIEIMGDVSSDLSELSALSVPVNYLKANAVVSEKAKSSVEEDIEKRTKEAAKRRAKRASE